MKYYWILLLPTSEINHSEFIHLSELPSDMVLRDISISDRQLLKFALMEQQEKQDRQYAGVKKLPF